MMDIKKNIIYDRFLAIESWAYRGKMLSEKGQMDKVRAAYKRMKKDMTELGVLLKHDEG